MDDLAAATATVARTAAAAPGTASAEQLLTALELLRRVQAELAAAEPALIGAARAAGVSWQTLAPVLGVASRQAAERRYLRAAADAGRSGGTRDDRVRAERDRRAGHRAVARWANDHTADLRSLAGQITALDLDGAAAAPLARLHDALGDKDASALPGLLADTHRHLDDHPELAARVDEVRAGTDAVRRRTQHHRDT